MSFKKFKEEIKIFADISDFFFIKKKRFLRKCSKPGHGNLVLITSTAQVENSKLNFNYDDIKKLISSSFNLLRFFKIIVL